MKVHRVLKLFSVGLEAIACAALGEIEEERSHEPAIVPKDATRILPVEVTFDTIFHT